jgi:uncharacterized protein (DUF885 family)
MKKIVKLILIICMVFGLAACKKKQDQITDQPDNEKFEQLLDDLFYIFLGTDPMNVNSSIYNLDNFRPIDAKVEPYEYSKEADEAYYASLKEIKEELTNYTDDMLSFDQELSRDVLIDYINRQLAFEDFYYYGTSLGSYLGYQAQLPLALAEYRFDDINDINDYFDYLKTTKQTFINIIAFEKEKITHNLGLTNYIIDKVIEQCDQFINEEENYLIPVFDEKIEAMDLSDTDKTSLKAQNQKLINEDFIGAYIYLRDELKTMKNTANHNGALANFPQGKAYYQALFQEATGSDMTIPEVKAYLQDIINDALNKASFVYDSLYQTDLMMNKSLDDLIPYFQKQMEGLFPKIDVTLTYEIKNINQSLQENASPAMYFISPIDENVKEVIYINPLQFTELNNYTYQTLAHEGFPGHLYQNLYLKTSDLPAVRKILRYTGYSEGWATYVENYVVGFVKPSAIEAFQFYDSLSYVILGLLDIGINYDGWSLNQAKKFINTYFNGIDDDKITDMYYELTEIPTNYLQYYFSYYQVQDLKASFKKKMGKNYSDLLFHEVYLKTGPASFAILKKQYENYVK